MSNFNDSLLFELDKPLSEKHVRVRKESGKDLSYIESHQVIRAANEIFKFDWSSNIEKMDTICEEEKKHSTREGVKNWYVSYKAVVSVHVNGATHQGQGFGQGINPDRGKAHEGAMKEAESDAIKRALRYFGNRFGLALYDKEQTYVTDADLPSYEVAKAQVFAAAEKNDKARVNALIKQYKLTSNEVVEKCKEIFARLAGQSVATSGKNLVTMEA